MNTLWRTGDLVALTVVILAALLVRGIYIYQQGSAPDVGNPVNDAEFFHAWAQAFADGERFTDQPYYRGPLYAWVLGTTYKLFGPGPLAPRLVNAVLGALACGLVFLIGRRHFSRLVGLIAGLATATYWVLVFFTGELLIPTLITFLDLLLIWLLPRAFRRPRPVNWVAAGVVLGLSGMARPNVLLFAPAVVAWMPAVYGRPWRRMLPGVAAFTAGCLAPVLPVTVRNYVVGRDLVLISSQGGVNFCIGNNPQTNGVKVQLPGTRPHWHETYLDQIAIAERAAGRSLKPSEVSRFYFRRACRFINDHPADAAALMLAKLRFFVGRYEAANNKDLYDYTARYTPIVKYLPLGFGLVCPLGLVGLVVCWPRRRELFPLWGFVVVYTVSVVLFFVSARFRVPVVPVLILYATVACAWLLRAAAERRWKGLSAALLLLILLAVVSNTVEKLPTSPAWWDTTVAALLARDGKTDEAIAAYQKAIALDPNDAEAYSDLASLYNRRGELDEAVRLGQRAIKLAPNYARGHARLGSTLAGLGRFEEAVHHLRRSVQLIPHDPGVQHLLGQVLLDLGRADEAVEHLRRAAELREDRPTAWQHLAEALDQAGRTDQAGHAYEQLTKLAPQQAPAYLGWSRLLARRGDIAGAVSVLRQGRQAVPDDAEMANDLAWWLATAGSAELRSGSEALKLAEFANEATGGRNVQMLDTLAAAQAEAGRFDEAVATADKAIDIAQQADALDLAARIAARRSLYEKRQAYREPHNQAGME